MCMTLRAVKVALLVKSDCHAQHQSLLINTGLFAACSHNQAYGLFDSIYLTIQACTEIMDILTVQWQHMHGDPTWQAERATKQPTRDSNIAALSQLVRISHPSCRAVIMAWNVHQRA